MFWDRARKRARNPQNAKSVGFHMVVAENRLRTVRAVLAPLRADMFRAAYRGCGCFVRFCAQAHRNRNRLPASVRRCECAEMHIIPIADQFAESIPIAYQYTKHVNDMRSALAAPARPLARSPRRCAASQRAMRRSQSAPSDARHMARRSQRAMRRSQRAMRRSQGESSQVSDRKVQQNQGLASSQG